ncbi:hypothetical protein LCGC14_0363430 [marine sediment metagenome]|uniref:Uncharacterized protein n=1 Tax=marine sediment metagenome TaxID=412755 RepID=A0A0F9VUJ2_9ZZZZ
MTGVLELGTNAFIITSIGIVIGSMFFVYLIHGLTKIGERLRKLKIGIR